MATSVLGVCDRDDPNRRAAECQQISSPRRATPLASTSTRNIESREGLLRPPTSRRTRPCTARRSAWRRVLLLLYLLTLNNGPAAAADDTPKVKVILIDGQNNHNWRATTPVLKKVLEDSGRFTVDVSSNLKTGDKPGKVDKTVPFPPDLSKYDVVREQLQRRRLAGGVQQGARRARSRTARSAWSSSTPPTTPSAAGRSTTR